MTQNILTFFKRLIFIFASYVGFSQDTLYLNRVMQTLVNGEKIMSLEISKIDTFSQSSAVLQWQPNEMHVLHIINHDTMMHQLQLANQTFVVGALGSVTQTINPLSVDLYWLKSVVKEHQYLGMNLIVDVNETHQNSFYWNLQAIDNVFNERIAEGVALNYANFNPHYYTINKLSQPDIQNDTSAVVTGKVGDTIRLVVANAGLQTHAIHFHGYHVIIKKASVHTHMIGWEKDTYPVAPNELHLVEIIPDKPGIYPVHDHNLMATLANGEYGKGMLVYLNISER